MNDRETKRLHFIKDPAPYYSWTVVDKSSGKTVAKVFNEPKADVSLHVWGGARLTIDQVREIFEVMTSLIPDSGQG